MHARVTIRSVALWFAVCATSAAQAPRLPAVFADHMVLLRESSVRVFGDASPGEKITVSGSWKERAASGVADPDGKFQVVLGTPPAGGPHRVTVAGERGEVVFEDVWSGEVWLASGQSNMEMPVGRTRGPYRGVIGFPEVIAAADHPRVRFFQTGDDHAPAPRTDSGGGWTVCSPDTVATQSAVAYFFARALSEALDVPVGVLCATDGGSPIAAWMSAGSLADLEEFDAELSLARRCADDPGALAVLRREQLDTWWREVEDEGDERRFSSSDHDDSDWEEIALPAPIESRYRGFDGVVWLRRTVTIPDRFAGRDLRLELGPIDDMDTTFFDGVRVGGRDGYGGGAEDRRYRVPGRLVTAGEHVLAIRVIDYFGPGGLVGKRRPTLTPLNGGGRIALDGAWRCRRGRSAREFPRWPKQPPFHWHSPTALFNARVAPLAPVSVRGVLWYQGEADVKEPARYRTLFPRLIEDWRGRFGDPTLPFLFVQLAPFHYPATYPAAELRDAQASVLGMPGIGMATTVDVGDADDLHPRRKREVGERLALLALDLEYGRDVESTPPRPAGCRRVGGELVITFDAAPTVDGERLLGLEVAGPDRVYHPAEGLVRARELHAHSDAVATPVAARYAWGAATTGNLRGSSGLPVAPFRVKAD